MPIVELILGLIGIVGLALGAIFKNKSVQLISYICMLIFWILFAIDRL